jgi:hypothetical protein
MPTTTPLQSIELTSDTGSVVFSNIDQSYTDLIVVCRSRTSASSSQDLIYRFNDDSATNYSQARMYTYAVGGAAWSTDRTSNRTSISGAWSPGTNMGSANYGQTVFHINNYSNSTTYKTVLSNMDVYGNTDSVNDNNIAGKMVGQWRSTSAITSIVFYMASGNIVAGSTFDLYGIKSGAPKAMGGDLVTTDGNYWYHTFISSGTFLLQQPTSVDYLVVAGGASGGNPNSDGVSGAGGGAGGLRSTVGITGGGGSLETPLSLTAQAYTVTIGAGGAVNGTSGQRGNSGSNSVFASITSTGGGAGGGQGSSSPFVALSGGSGGGGAYGLAGAAGTANQGYAGGTAASSGAPNYGSAGGGGAGAVGANGTSSVGGAGGAGVASSISGSSVTRAGGGGGGSYGGTAGAGGSGGGGTGGSSANGTAGTANTGGGGGGGGAQNRFGANGGSGVVIVRYPV